MKTAEEWAAYYKSLMDELEYHYPPEGYVERMNKFITEIQLDAWKQGIKDSIETIIKAEEAVNEPELNVFAERIEQRLLGKMNWRQML